MVSGGLSLASFQLAVKALSRRFPAVETAGGAADGVPPLQPLPFFGSQQEAAGPLRPRCQAFLRCMETLFLDLMQKMP